MTIYNDSQIRQFPALPMPRASTLPQAAGTACPRSAVVTDALAAQEPGLGIIPLGVQAAAQTIINLFGNNPNPARRAQIDLLKNMALNGDQLAYIALKADSGQQVGNDPLLANKILPPPYASLDNPTVPLCGPSNNACGMASSTAKAYALAAIAEIDARRATAGALIQGAGAATSTAIQLSPGTTIGPVWQKFQTVALIGGAAFVAYYLFGRKRR